MNTGVGGICPKTNAFASLIKINGEEFYFHTPDGKLLTEDYSKFDKTQPYWNTVNNPAIGYTEQSEQLVKSTRNAKGQVVAEKINRRINKFENLYWPYLSCYDVTWLKKQIAKFHCTIWYWDSELDKYISRQFYWGDFEATPCEWETVRVPVTGEPHHYYKKPIWYRDVKCNLIDKGY